MPPITGDRLSDCFVSADGIGLELCDDEAVFFFEEKEVDEACAGAADDGGADVVGLAE